MKTLKEHRVIIAAVILSLAVHFALLAKISAAKPRPAGNTVMLELIKPSPEAAAFSAEKKPPETKASPAKKAAPKKKTVKTQPKKEPVKKPEPPKEAEIAAEKPKETPPAAAEPQAGTADKEIAEPVPTADASDAPAGERKTEAVPEAASDMSSSPEAVYISANYDSIRRLFLSELKYPDKARRMGLEGEGSVMLTIGKDGKIKSVSLSDEFGSRLLDEAAIKAGKRLRRVSAPGVEEVRVVIPVTFSLY